MRAPALLILAATAGLHAQTGQIVNLRIAPVAGGTVILTPGSTVNFSITNLQYRLEGGSGVILWVAVTGPGDVPLTGSGGAAVREFPARQSAGTSPPINDGKPIEFPNLRVPPFGPLTVWAELRRASDQSRIAFDNVHYVVRGTRTTTFMELQDLTPANGTSLTAGQRVNVRATFLVEHPTENNSRVISRIRVSLGAPHPEQRSLGGVTRPGLNQFLVDFSDFMVPSSGPVLLTIALLDLPYSLPVITYPVVGAPPPPAQRPVITRLDPDSAVAGGPAFQLTVTGQGFSSALGSRVEWDGTLLQTSVLSSEALTAQVPATLLPVPQGEPESRVAVRVRNAFTSFDPSIPVFFTIRNPLIPDNGVISGRRLELTDYFLPGYENYWVEPNTSCLFGGESVPLAFDVDRYVGELLFAGDGRLRDAAKLVGNGVVAKYARLQIAAFDVDSGAPVGAAQPERDEVVTQQGVKLQNLAGNSFLEGRDKQWVVSEFQVPIEELRFPARQRNPPGRRPIAVRNSFRINMDVASRTKTWCAAVDWAMLSIKVMAPLMLVHGTNAQAGTWEYKVGAVPSVVEHLTAKGIPFGHPINLKANGSFEENAGLLRDQVSSMLREFGTGRYEVHLVAHSKGATDSRWMLSRKRNQMGFRVLSLFSIGTPSQGTVGTDLVVVAGAKIRLGVTQAVVSSGIRREELERVLGDAATGLFVNWFDNPFTSDTPGVPLNPAANLQRPHNLRRINFYILNPFKPPDVPYFAIAGNADQNANWTIDLREEWAGMLDPPLSELDNTPSFNAVYQALRRIRFVNVVYVPFFGIAQFTVTPANAFLQNDLVSTVESTLCTKCGFERLPDSPPDSPPLPSFNLNHTLLKHPAAIDLILDKIREIENK